MSTHKQKSIVSQASTDRALELSPVCLGCGAEGTDTMACDRCGKQICSDCSPDRDDDDDFPVDLCEKCCDIDPIEEELKCWR